MRILAIFGGVLVLAGVAAFGGALLGQQIELTAKQTRALNADIDRIVAERHDKNRAFTEVAKAGLPALASASTSVKDTRKVEEQVRKVAANPMPKLEVDAVAAAAPAETAGAAAQSETPAETKNAQVARAPKNAKRRTARLYGPERVIPLAFASLPKFTAHTLLGLR